jgi:hypothetical protein
MSTKTRRPKCAPGYRWLRKGEVVKEGDEFVWDVDFSNGEYKNKPHFIHAHACIGNKIGEMKGVTFRRKVEVKAPEVKPEPVSPLPKACDAGYRYMVKGETIEKGDEWLALDNTWRPSDRVGCLVNARDTSWSYYRRKIVTPVQKYRPLKAGEKLETGDEYFDKNLSNEWLDVRPHWVGCQTNMLGFSGFEYRRKVPNDYKYEQPAKPASVVQSHDRVKVSSKYSRFLGATGVIVDYRYYNKLANKACRVKYDVPQEKEKYTHSWFWATELERTEDKQAMPVEPIPYDGFDVGKGYRRLGQDEKMKKTDEIIFAAMGNSSWIAVGGLAEDTPGDCGGSLVARRKVGDGYRFLIENEPLRISDEQVVGFNEEEPVWGPLDRTYYSCVVGPFNAKFKKFRRKV